MTTRESHGEPRRVRLRGPSVQYSSGKVVTPRPFDLEDVLAEFVRLPEDARGAFLSIVAHSLTVDMRVALLDRPIADKEADRAWRLNEWLHQLTSSLNPCSQRGAEGETELLRSIATASFLYGLEAAIGRAIATAAGNTVASAKKHTVAVG
jgi:hypothetical protein